MDFKHSVKLSTQYRAAIKILRNVMVNKESYRTLLFNQKHARTNRLNALLDKFLRNRELIENVIEKSEILINEPRLDPYACRIIVTELLLGHENGLKSEAKPIQTVLNHKEKLLELFKDSESKFITKLNVPIPRYVRINLLKITFDDAIEECIREGFRKKSDIYENYPDFINAVKTLDEYEFLVDFHVKQLLVFSSKTRSYWAGSQLVSEHKFILQDKASCIAPMLLELKKKSCVLDMCAAPGMKTTQMAAIMKNKGVIYANDYDKNRYEALCLTVKNKNAKCVTTINRDALQLNSEEYPNVEYILIDPSCSGSGMVSRCGDTHKDKERILNLSRLQTKLLVHTMQTFTNAKRVVYSTCSILTDENEHVVQKALHRCPQFELLDPRSIVGDSWINFGSEKYEDVAKNCLYCYEDTDLTNGFFCAVFVNKNLNKEEENNLVNVKNEETEIIIESDNFKTTETSLNDTNDKKVKTSKKKKKKSSKDEENENQNFEIQTDILTESNEDSHTKAKKKKKRSTEVENGHDNENETDRQIETSGTSETGQKKSKKKTSKTCSDNVEQIFEDVTAKKHKSKKSKNNVEKEVCKSQNGGISDLDAISKKKSKKSNGKLEEQSTEYTNEESTTLEREKKTKKRKALSLTIDIEYNQMQDKQTIKKKKKNDKNM